MFLMLRVMYSPDGGPDPQSELSIVRNAVAGSKVNLDVSVDPVAIQFMVNCVPW